MYNAGSWHNLKDASGRICLWQWTEKGGGSWMRHTKYSATFVHNDAAAMLGWEYVGPKEST